MRPLLVAALLLCASAEAGKRKKKGDEETPPPTSDSVVARDGAPSWAPVKDPNASVDPCPTTPPPGWRLELGYARGETPAEAMDQAREKARAQLLEKACAGVSALRCERIKRNIAPWEKGLWDAGQQSACAAMAIENKVLSGFEDDMTRLEADLASFAQTAATAAAGREVAIAAPTWASGCIATGIGASVAGKVRNAMVQAGAKVLGPGVERPAADLLKISMAPARDVVTLNAALKKPGTQDKALAGFEFRADLFSIDEGEVGECATDSGLGLQDGEKIGKGGLRVRVSLPTNDGQVCEGETTTARVTVSKPAEVQLYSVARDGTAYLVWPPPKEYGVSGAVDKELELGPLELIKPAGFEGDESLVAVAMPRGEEMGPTQGLHGFCRLDVPFTSLTYHRDAAVGRATYGVIRDGTQGCVKRVTAQQREKLERDLRLAPVCR